MKAFLCNLLIAIAFPFSMASAQTAFHTETQAVNYVQTLKGKIGPYAVTMQLDMQNGEEGQFVGTYYYNDRPKTKFRLKLVKMEAINIHGSMKVVLKEYSPQGKQTGTFNGQYECRGDYYAGTFTNSKGQKFKFELQ